jgi:hypothetical protein
VIHSRFVSTIGVGFVGVGLRVQPKPVNDLEPMPARRPAPLRFLVAINADLFGH